VKNEGKKKCNNITLISYGKNILLVLDSDQYSFRMLDADPYSFEMLDPNPCKTNIDPKPWSCLKEWWPMSESHSWNEKMIL